MRNEKISGNFFNRLAILNYNLKGWKNGREWMELKERK